MRKINFFQPIIFGYKNKDQGKNFNEEFQLLYPEIAKSIKKLVSSISGTEEVGSFKPIPDFQTSNLFKQDFKVLLEVEEETFSNVVFSVTIKDVLNNRHVLASMVKAPKVTGPSIGLPYFDTQEEPTFIEKPKVEQAINPKKDNPQKLSSSKNPDNKFDLTLSELQLLTKVSNGLLTCVDFPEKPLEVSGVPKMYLYYFRNKKLCERITKDRNIFFLKKIEEAIDQRKIKQPSISKAENYRDFSDKLFYLQEQGIDVANLLGYGILFLLTIGTKECVFTPEECVVLNSKLDALFDDYKSGKLRAVKTTAVELKANTPIQDPWKEIFEPAPDQASAVVSVQVPENIPDPKTVVIAKMTKFNKDYIAKAKEEIKSNKYTRNGIPIKGKISTMCFLENRRRLFLVSHSMQKVSSLLDIPFNILKKVTNFANPPSNEEQLALHLYLNDNKEVIKELESFKD